MTTAHASKSRNALGGPTGTNFADSLRQPGRWAAALACACAVPFVLHVLGVDFSTASTALTPDTAAAMSGAELTESAFRAMRGSFSHTLLEWTAFCAAVFVGLLAFVQFRLTREPSLPVIGIALVCAGAMDGFHTFAADRLIHSVADNRD